MAAAFDSSTLAPAVKTLVDALAPEQRGASEVFVKYAVALARFGAHTDLVGAKTPAALAEIALADALVLARNAALCVSPGWEIGAGGASLSVPLALMVPGFSGRLVEPRQKRATFLRLAIGTLGLAPRLSIDQVRVDLAHPPHDVAGCAFGRAVFAPDAWLPLAATVVKAGGAFAVLTTGDLAVPAGYDMLASDRYTLPFARVERVITWLRAIR